MRINYELNDRFDLTIFLSASLLVIIGLFAIYSSTQNTITQKGNFDKQLISWGISLFVFFFIFALPTKLLKLTAVPAYVLSILLLLVVLVIGRRIGGARSWIALGGFSFQPAEFAKLATILFLSHFLSRSETDLDNLKDIFIALAIGMTPIALIMLEPDLGSSFVFIGVILALLFWKGISLFGLAVVLSPGIVAVASLFGPIYFAVAIGLVIVILFYFKKDIILSGSILALNIASGFFVDNIYNILSPHQQRRIQTFIDPNADPLGSGYNAIQAKVAIGSGGFFGKGFLHGNQTQLQFIPEQWTDFIFCVIGEEFGFIGSIFVIILFLILFLRILRLASFAKNEFLSLVIIGILAVFFVHFLVNIGMAIGILPVIGIPLPFVSYGGSSLLINMALLGIILNIYRSRKEST
ncbi:MAG: rod shape-determining protein RodA [Ignavibacteria bacterium CG08_land_8_20_14_0_20_37_9]|nr:rod shape-determining protein RodA [Ignavibacteria bacterium]PIS45873.1 MAG: rod shape-determining protein RodA [Ignavibacteria bacterium CG08_land_8_20_14_0_20_37_9]PIX94749.1 MAG: rod shape-determining protein RodA [Ignavibacteria bacterium CG_4_10_14_3_um_filter_37_18]